MGKRKLFLVGFIVCVLGLLLFANRVWIGKLYAIYTIVRTPIDLFGKVIDEDGKPVPGAKTSYIVSTLSWKGSPTLEGPVTDSEGKFAITGKRGPEISVMVHHPNYYETDSARQKITFSKDLAPKGQVIPTADNPAVFTLHKKGEAEFLIHHIVKAKLPTDGTPVSFDLKKGALESGDSTLTLALQSDGNTLPINQYYPFNWTLRIEVTGGGIEERNNRFQFRAPTDGYQTSLSFSKEASLPRNDWKGSLQKDFFILLPSGAHARIHLQLAAEHGHCTIESFLNPDPTLQNLE